MALPLNGSERAVVTAISFYIPPDGDSSYPSYATIHEKSGIYNDTIAKVIRTLEYAGVLERNHRANIIHGKESNLYRFTFDGIKFNRNDELSKADYAAFKAKMIGFRKLAKDKPNKKQTAKRSIPPDSLNNDTSTYREVPKSQSADIGIRATTSSKASTIPPHIEPIPPHIMPRSIDDSVPLPNGYTSQSTVDTNESQSQKRLDRMKNINPTAQSKDPRDQSNNEWWASYEEAERKAAWQRLPT